MTPLMPSAFLPRAQEVPEEEGVSEEKEPGDVQQLEEDEVDKELEAARRADVAEETAGLEH